MSFSRKAIQEIRIAIETSFLVTATVHPYTQKIDCLDFVSNIYLVS